MEEMTTSKQTILVVGHRDYVVENVRTLLEREGFETHGLLSDQEDLQKRLTQHEYQLLLIGGGVDPHIKATIGTWLKEARPLVPMIEHSGGPATVLPEVRKMLSLT